MSGRSADKAVTRSSVVGSSIDQQLDSNDCARLCTEATMPQSLASLSTQLRMLVSSALSVNRPSERRLSASAAWHLSVVSYNIKTSTTDLSAAQLQQLIGSSSSTTTTLI